MVKVSWRIGRIWSGRCRVATCIACRDAYQRPWRRRRSLKIAQIVVVRRDDQPGGAGVEGVAVALQGAPDRRRTTDPGRTRWRRWRSPPPRPRRAAGRRWRAPRPAARCARVRRRRGSWRTPRHLPRGPAPPRAGARTACATGSPGCFPRGRSARRMRTSSIETPKPGISAFTWSRIAGHDAFAVGRQHVEQLCCCPARGAGCR